MLAWIQQERDRSMKVDYLLVWAANAAIVAVLPAKLGWSGAPLLIFLTYAVTAGIVLTLAEDLRYATLAFTRTDIRSYLKVRVGLVAVFGIVPFLLGRALS
ncbi:hypothetical protein [Sphingomonas prati]|uniref:Putative membrane protein YwaF n=1 Tax=Sphingomonas prati TaxID=1843237 RepID=A0A7W9BSD8_9SPHN|nr:hypothetical protein [Sphingomonas prati]MBB5729054.1 putative membrane protein YwaF [Sphingomonas prati]GGE85440.1 hypothetical protein GCM10011404_17780 [Sphingomonas prati]